MSNEPQVIEAELSPTPSEPTRQASGSSHWIEQLAENRALVIGILFLVTGVPGLPLLWISSRFTLFQKLALSILVTIYTLVLIVIVSWIVMWSWARVSDALS